MSPAVIRRTLALTCFFLVALVNCGGGGGGDESDNGGIVAMFEPHCLSADPCYSGSVTMQKGITSGAIVEVKVILNKLNTVIGGAGLEVEFDPTQLEYQNYTKGPALGTGSQTTYFVTESSGGVGASIVVAGGKSISSEGVMITFVFKALKAGESNVIFLNQNSLDGTALYRTDGSIIALGSAGWSGGREVAN